MNCTDRPGAFASALFAAVALIAAPVCKAAAQAPAPAADAPDAGAPAAVEPPAAVVTAYDPMKPATWRLSAKLPKGSALREQLIRELTAKPKVTWQAALTREEAEAILDDPRAELIYAERTISIVAPSMLRRQRRGHIDLLKVFLKEERLAAAEKFVAERRESLERAEKRHGVDKEVIVSILMWESRLGTITGDYVAFNSFVSQAFFIDEANAVALSDPEEKKLLDPKSQPARVERIRQRARANLVVLLRVCKARGIDPLEVKGSWAGALGFPQFMPASLRWAEDGDGDGKIDLFTFDDSIASIGRYLKDHGWAKSCEKAVWGYNHEDAYVKGVLAFADALKKRLEKPGPRDGAENGAPKPAAEALDAGAAAPIEAAAEGGAQP
ncbi:MAG: lytic murein transglycosylase [Myxococcales bacterium]|jgi:membrane-bound lytic murein transglycosylase B